MDLGGKLLDNFTAMCIAIPNPVLKYLLSCKLLVHLFLLQPWSIYIIDMLLEAVEADVPEQCQHQVWALK